MVGSWWLVTVVLAAAYSGSLVAHLSLTRPYLPFRSLEDLVKQSQYKWGTVRDAAIHSIVKVCNCTCQTSYVAKTLSQRFQFPVSAQNSTTALGKVHACSVLCLSSLPKVARTQIIPELAEWRVRHFLSLLSFFPSKRCYNTVVCVCLESSSGV